LQSIVVSLLAIGLVGCAVPEANETSGESRAMGQDDSISLPPKQAELRSPSGEYLFVFETVPGAKPPRSTGTLFRTTDGERTILWSRELPQEYRARFGAVSDGGRVLLLDEWINVASPYAVMVLSPQGELIAQHDFDAVAAVLGVSRNEIVAAARTGWWIQAPPSIVAGSEVATVAAAGKLIAISLLDGSLSINR
jgi:hypothetical protein